MASSCLILLTLIFPFVPSYAQISSSEELSLVQNEERTILREVDSKVNDMEVKMHATPPQTPEAAKTTDVMSHRGHTLTPHHKKRHFRNVYGILILLGWGTLLPIGVIVARYCRKFPLNCNEWYSCHIVCQTLGYILGTIGWCVGLWLRSTSNSEHYVSKTQRTLSIIAFTFINVQMLSIFMRPNKEAGYCKCWNICHHVLGYAIIGMVIANIFVGLNNHKGEKMKWAYVGILGVLALVAIPLEIFRCWSTKQFVRLARSMFSNSP